MPLADITCFGSIWPKRIDVDLLGYFVNWDSPAFQAVERAALDDIHARVGRLCAALTAAGSPVALDELFAVNPRYAGLVRLIDVSLRKQNAPTWAKAEARLRRYWPAVSHSAATIQATIAASHAAGGVAVLAHPVAVSNSGRGWIGAEQVAVLVQAGLDGLEIYHPSLDEAARRHFLALAEQFRLVVSGGSDEHSLRHAYERFGRQPVTPAMVEALRVRAHRWQAA